MTFYTDYKTAANWNNQNLVLCNKIPEIDQSIYDNMRFNLFTETCPNCGSDNIEKIDISSDYCVKCNNCNNTANETNEDQIEIYQWYLSDLSEDSVKYMEETFNLKYTYSDLLDCFVLCVDHYGTAWDYVACEVKSEGWIEVNKDKEFKH